MAKILGESGRYVSDEAARQKRQIIITVIIIIALLGVIGGIVLSTLLPLSWLTPVGKAVIVLVAAVGIWILDKWSDQQLNAIEKKKDNYLRGATGEILVGELLTKLPDGYCVINDLATPNGNLDHVVVGPTGVFVLDTKAWRGVVATDGKGELLLNGKPMDKPYVRQFVGRMMGVRDKVLTLAPGMEVRHNAVFVFTAAWVEAKWGTTGYLNCVADDQLYNYITEKDFGKKLNAEEVREIAQAFLGLAHMDKEFGLESKSKPQVLPCTMQPAGAD
ncbi:MAG: nuclease-related domain-containing protein [Verrucomicrobiia bacterium]